MFEECLIKIVENNKDFEVLRQNQYFFSEYR